MSDLDELAKAANAHKSAETTTYHHPASYPTTRVSHPADESRSTKKATGQGIATGVIIGVMMFALGGVLIGFCWPVGLVLLVGAFIAPFMGIGSVSGSCPYCGSKLLAQPLATAHGGITCRACKKRVIVRNKRYYRVD